MKTHMNIVLQDLNVQRWDTGSVPLSVAMTALRLLARGEHGRRDLIRGMAIVS
jgi:hypothetical protein